MVRYPYTLQGATGQIATQDENGYAVNADVSWQALTRCRDEGNGAGNQVPGVDGSDTLFKAQVFMPLTAPTIQQGTLVRVLDGTTVRIQGMVLRYERLQTYARLWV